MRLIGLLGVVWLNMALNPCAMALSETDETDCPHCPPAQHCDEQAIERCNYLDTIDSDGRTHQTRTPDFSDYEFVLPPVLVVVPTLRVDSSTSTEFLQTTGPPGPPLYVRHCAYLK